MKFGGDLQVARLLGRLLSDELRSAGDAADYVIPVPLHRQRLLGRGYNQALQLAKEIETALKIPLLRSACQRIRPTRPQTSMSGKTRRGNVRGAFEAGLSLRGLRVAIVDDVITSGETAEATATALKRAGAVSVLVWACARAGGLDGR